MTKFAIIDAVEKPKTQRTGLQLYPWQDLTGKGFCADETAKSRCVATNRTNRQPVGQAERRRGLIVPLYLDGSDGVFVQRVA